MSNTKDLNEAFYETLRDVYYAEKQSIKACKISARKAQAQELKTAFEEHQRTSEAQLDRLAQVFETLGKSPRGKTCEAMAGIVSEMEEDLEDFGGTQAGDAVLIGCAQAIEHYEISRYGTLAAWAKQLGNKQAAELLNETLREEKQTDERLSKLGAQVNA